VADDINPALRTELVAALAVLTPELRGLHDLTTVSISPALASSVWLQIVIRERRRDLIQLAIDSLDNALVTLTKLEADGYPTLDPATIDAAELSELQGEKSDLESAIALFTPETPASSLVVNLGQPVAR